MNFQFFLRSLLIGLLTIVSAQAADPIDGDIVAAAQGRLEGAADIVPLGTAATGVVKAILVKEGDRVAKGQVVVEIDCDLIKAEIREREAQVATEDIGITRLKAGARDEELAIAISVVRVSEARAEESEKALQRLQSLQEGIASRARILEAERDSKMAAAQLLESRQRLRMLQAGVRGEDLAEAEAKKVTALAALDHVKKRLEQCTVRAPGDGVVLTTNVTAGQYISATTPVPLLRMVDVRVLRVRAEVDEQDVAKICLGQTARVTADGFKGITSTGKVTQMNPGMGRRTILSGDPTEKADRDVREVLVTLDSTESRWPVGLRMLVFFSKC
jgi:HlyD family secretion protein